MRFEQPPADLLRTLRVDHSTLLDPEPRAFARADSPSSMSPDTRRTRESNTENASAHPHSPRVADNVLDRSNESADHRSTDPPPA